VNFAEAVTNPWSFGANSVKLLLLLLHVLAIHCLPQRSHSNSNNDNNKTKEQINNRLPLSDALATAKYDLQARREG